MTVVWTCQQCRHFIACDNYTFKMSCRLTEIRDEHYVNGIYFNWCQCTFWTLNYFQKVSLTKLQPHYLSFCPSYCPHFVTVVITIKIIIVETLSKPYDDDVVALTENWEFLNFRNLIVWEWCPLDWRCDLQSHSWTKLGTLGLGIGTIICHLTQCYL